MMYGQNLGSEKTCNRIPAGSVGIEIGVWKGDSSERFLNRAGHLHLVDSWSPIAYEHSTEHGSYENYLKRYEVLVGSRNPNDYHKFYDGIANSVQEINQFYAAHQREPEEGDDINERKLFSRLGHIREDYEKHNKKFVSSWNLKGMLGPFKGEDNKQNK